MWEGISNRLCLAFAVVAIVSWVAIAEGGLLASSYTADSVRYMRMAENIKAGHLMNPNGIVGSDGWFAIWPIGYPTVLAAISMLTGLEVFWASKLISVLCTMGLLFLFWKRGGAAFPLLALGLVNLAYLKISRSSLSEPLFMLVLVAIGFVAADISERQRCDGFDWHSFFMLWLLFVGLFLVRYVGFFAPVWIGAALLLGRCRRSVIKTISFAGAAAWVVDGAYWLMNKTMCGFVSGYGRSLPKETGRELLQMVIAAEMHELQAYGILWFLAICLWFVIWRNRTQSQDSNGKGFSGRIFIVAGLLYHATVVFMRCRQSFDPLGFRLLYPGTLMIVVGIVLWMTQRGGHSGMLNWIRCVEAIPKKYFIPWLVIFMLFGGWILHGELQLRDALGMSVYRLGDSYPNLKERMLAKYKEVPAGTRVNIGCSCCDEDFIIAALRPDIIIETTEK